MDRKCHKCGKGGCVVKPGKPVCDECRYRKRAPGPVEKRCEECGNAFLAPPGQAHNKKTCGPECARERSLQRGRKYAKARFVPAPREYEPIECHQCGGSFAPYNGRQDLKYCSDLCKNKAQNLQRRAHRNPNGRTCHKCGKAGLPFKKGTAVCDDCRTMPLEKARRKQWNRRLRAYGLTQAQYDQMLEHQEHKCAICRRSEWGRTGTPHIDHCHETGRVRALLCDQCNLGLGQFKDNERNLSIAAAHVSDEARLDYFRDYVIIHRPAKRRTA